MSSKKSMFASTAARLGCVVPNRRVSTSSASELAVQNSGSWAICEMSRIDRVPSASVASSAAWIVGWPAPGARRLRCHGELDERHHRVVPSRAELALPQLFEHGLEVFFVRDD